jgi:peptidoglycan/LPS O-acetylase OafA/YrhL
MLTRSETSQMPKAVHADYRPDIDGLRAISILAVIWYHAFPELVPGGFVGVDIFFVISGFLITRIISTELANDSFSILSFYRRRIRRIFPALIVVLAATFAFGWVVLLPRDFATLGADMAAGAGFVANLMQLKQQDYFAADAATNPLLHLWSLGIEEQFYILWPLLLIWLARSRFRAPLIVGLAAASMVANLLLVGEHQAIAFYSPLTRAWELLAGALLVHTTAHGSVLLRRVPDDLKAAAGLVLIALAIAFLDSTSKYPGWGALMPVGGAVLLLDAPRAAINRVLLSYRVMVYIGLISYPLYLWHWPLLSYLGILRNGVPTSLEKDLAVGLGFVLAAGTYHFIEKTIRSRRHAVLGLIPAMTTIATVGLVTVAAGGFNFRFPADVAEIAGLPRSGNSGFRADCFFLKGVDALPRQERCIEGGTAPLLFVWGDSTAAALYPGLKAAEQRHEFRIAQFTGGGCPPILAGGDYPQCEAMNEDTLETIRTAKPEIVLLHARWGANTNLPALRETIAALKRLGVPRVVILGPVPVWKRSLPFTLVNTYRFLHRVPDRLAITVNNADADELMARFSSGQPVEYLSSWKQLCNSEGCITRVGPKATDVVAWDEVHLSDRGAVFLGAAVTDELFGR